MSVSIAEFWKLAVESKLLSSDDARKYNDAFTRAKGGAVSDGDLQRLAKSLISNGVISRYQAKVLLAGRAGPFVYGDYQIYDRLEAGRLAGVFRARHLATRHPVCLYFLSGPGLQDPQALARLAPQTTAAETASRDQPHLARCYHWSDLGGYKFVVLEDLHGESAADRLSAKGKMAPEEACRMVREAAVGLESLHKRQPAHGQIRPANLWLGEYDRVKLLGFPLAQDPLGAPQAALQAQADYLAPELAQGNRAADPRSDVYSLGCTLFHLLTAMPPFAGGDLQKKLTRHASAAPPLDKLNGLAPPALVQVLAYMLHKNPDQRYQQAAALVQALTPYASQKKAQAPTILPSAQHYEAWVRQRAATSAASAPSTPAPTPAMAVHAGGAPAVAPNGARTAAMPVAAPNMAAVGAPGFAAQTGVAAPAMTAAPGAASAGGFPNLESGPIVSTGGTRTSSAVQRAKKSSGSSMALLGSIGAGLLLVGGAVIAFVMTQEPAAPSGTPGAAPAAAVPAQPQPLDAKAARNAALAEAGTPDTIQSIGDAIWESPTSGPPVDLAYLAPGAQAVLALRPAQLTTRSEWEKLSDPRTLGTLSTWLSTSLPMTVGTSLENMDSAVIGLLDGGAGPPRVSLVVRTVSAVPQEELLKAWGDPREEQLDNETIWTGKGAGYYLPVAGKQQIIVIAPPAEIREIPKAGGQAPPLRREMESLLSATDSDRDLTLVFAPNFTFSGAKALFTEQGAKLQEPLDAFLVMENVDKRLELPKAASLSIHLAGDSFVEFRVYNSYAGRPMGAVVQDFHDRIAHLPKQVSEYVRDLYLSDYSKPVLWDYKDQLEVLAEYARAGVDGKQAVLRAYLPLAAAHNLALGAHLALLENPGGGPTAVAAARAPKEPQTIAEKLLKKTSLSFPRNTLEMSVQMLGEDVGIDIVILGSDLQQEGITKNQSFGLDERDQTAGDILRKIMILSNPAGKLIYVIKPKEGGGPETLYVTTRAAAEKRGDKIPPELQAQPPAKK